MANKRPRGGIGFAALAAYKAEIDDRPQATLIGTLAPVQDVYKRDYSDPGSEPVKVGWRKTKDWATPRLSEDRNATFRHGDRFSIYSDEDGHEE